MKKEYTVRETEHTVRGVRFRIVVKKSDYGIKPVIEKDSGEIVYRLERPPKEKRRPWPPTKVMEFILRFLPEFEIIWNAIKTLPAPLNISSASKTTDITLDDQKKAVLACFDFNHDWECLNRRSLKKGRLWEWRVGKEKEDFRGKLLQELLDDHFPDLDYQYGYTMLEETAKELEEIVK